jgi:hypothetical protein
VERVSVSTGTREERVGQVCAARCKRTFAAREQTFPYRASRGTLRLGEFEDGGEVGGEEKGRTNFRGEDGWPCIRACWRTKPKPDEALRGRCPTIMEASALLMCTRQANKSIHFWVFLLGSAVVQSLVPPPASIKCARRCSSTKPQPFLYTTSSSRTDEHLDPLQTYRTLGRKLKEMRHVDGPGVSNQPALSRIPLADSELTSIVAGSFRPRA